MPARAHARTASSQLVGRLRSPPARFHRRGHTDIADAQSRSTEGPGPQSCSPCGQIAARHAPRRSTHKPCHLVLLIGGVRVRGVPVERRPEGGGHQAGVKRVVASFDAPLDHRILSPFSKSDSQRGPGALGSTESAPSRRALWIAPILGRLRARNGRCVQNSHSSHGFPRTPVHSLWHHATGSTLGNRRRPNLSGGLI